MRMRMDEVYEVENNFEIQATSDETMGGIIKEGRELVDLYQKDSRIQTSTDEISAIQSIHCAR